MASAKIEIDGLRELHRALGKFEPEARKDMMRELREVAKDVAADARALAPNRSGELRRSIRPQANRRGAAIVAKAPYASVFEFGGRHPVFGNRDVWVRQEARPFLRPARDKNRAKVLDRVTEILRKTAREVGL